MKILVIGGTGFLSTAIVEESLAAGHEVTIVTRGQRSHATPGQVKKLVADRTVSADFKSTVQRETFDLVIDAICFTAEHARQNIDCFGGRTDRLVMISTDFVYTVATRRLPITEDVLRDAPTDYGRNKAAAEDVLLSGIDLPATVLRPPHILGPSGLLGTGSLQGRDAALPARLRRHEPIVLLDSGTLLIQPVDRRDIARACLAVAAAPQCAGRAYNIAGPEAVMTRRYYEIIAETLETALKIACLPSEVYLKALPGNASFAQHRVYPLEALARDANFQPSIPLVTSIRETLAWLEQNPPSGADAPPSERDLKVIELLAERDRLILDALRTAE